MFCFVFRDQYTKKIQEQENLGKVEQSFQSDVSSLSGLVVCLLNVIVQSLSFITVNHGDFSTHISRSV